MKTAAEALVKISKDRVTISPTLTEAQQVTAQMKSYKQQLEANEKKRVQAATSAQTATQEILRFTENIVQRETGQFVLNKDHRYTFGGVDSYREKTVLGLIAFANQVVHAAEGTSEPEIHVRPGPQINKKREDGNEENEGEFREHIAMNQYLILQKL
ncbi:hypothetical protein H0H93_007992 [Arthromyces matolae]|nr:hypothetical protein H0H93_007992 [Arthromyces matolae]